MHYKNRAVGRSVLKIAGVYQTIDTPTQEQVASATEYYAGGHIYVISDATAVALSNAGYTVDLGGGSGYEYGYEGGY